jgi:hypothetical protein
VKILRYMENGRDIDNASYRNYEAHLDSIKDALPPSLFAMLRSPDDAYKRGATFYDAVVINWQDSIAFPASEHSTRVSIIGPNYDREFEFVLVEPRTTMNSSDRTITRIGELYCVEISRAVDGLFHCCFVFMSRVEIEVEAKSIEFVERPVSSIARQ